MSSFEAYLRAQLSKYQHPEIAKRDILSAFQTFTDLRPKMDTYVFNDGGRKELLCIEGTIPVNYKGNTYNIPICLWIMDSHPYNPPLAYVRPTNTMQIKPGRHVDTNGRIYLPYLHEWKHPQSDLLGLVQILTIVFGDEPPVFSRSSGSTGGGGSSLPYPSAGSAMPHPSFGNTGATGAGFNPPQPPTLGGGGASGGGSYGGYGSGAGFQQQQQQQQQASQQQSAYPPSYPAYPMGNSAPRNALPDDQIKMSLKSAVEDKMRRALKEIFAKAQAEMDVLRNNQDELTQGKQKLESMLQKMETEQNEVERNITILNEKNSELQEALEKMEGKEEVDVDEAVVPTAPLYKQLLNTYAEEQATTDALYYLGEALRKEVINVDVFLKQVRDLSRKQFMLRALVHKCREKAGLPELT